MMMRQLTPASAVNVDMIYESAFEGDYFQATLDLVKNEIPDAAIMLFGQDTVRPSGNYLLHRGLGDDAARSYVVDLATQNLWFQHQWQQEVGRVYQDRELLDRETFKETRFYRQWLRNWGALDCASGFVISRSGTRQLVLEVRYLERQENKNAPLARKVLEELAPHIVRAARICQLNHNHAVESQLTVSVLELFSFPTFLIDRDFLVHNMNARADALTGRMDSLMVSADGCLHAIEPVSAAELKAAVHALHSNPKRRTAMISLKKTDGAGRQFVTITKLNTGAKFDRGARAISKETRTHYALVAQDCDEPLGLSHDALWRTFGLSAKESDLAISLLEGETIGEYASKRQMSKQTLRNQLGTIMRKTDTSRQPQLVALLTRLAISAPN